MDCLVVLGGDGTLQEVIHGLKADIPIAFIPLGTGNDFAR
ncbi:diacylglycerol kinase family enzyme [Alkalibacillus flavidus]|uniref:Diacylglycerol kinase family enzyme n=1 Tax=Alkalibacillus flavidus TaxID=546021 RepID=A0ABV2KVU1_9BACI